ncbi:hypothetical protein RGQ29_015730 [Quercus rubra]|uniref:Uncharacterized protein n=1 Tax=Quercus rubra TaxID=3512 RepID=A0AAN7FQT0_QUERU|nr:hypothetical protein RGQ29_015730 [Quercus rubra]
MPFHKGLLLSLSPKISLSRFLSAPKTLTLDSFAMKGGKAKADTRRTDSRLKSKGATAAGKKQSKKAAKDPNKPKRPASIL